MSQHDDNCMIPGLCCAGEGPAARAVEATLEAMQELRTAHVPLGSAVRVEAVYRTSAFMQVNAIVMSCSPAKLLRYMRTACRPLYITRFGTCTEAEPIARMRTQQAHTCTYVEQATGPTDRQL